MRAGFLMTGIFVFCFLFAKPQTQTVGLFLNDSLSFNGYTLFGPMHHDHVYLIDNCGYKVNEWDCGPHGNNMAYILEDGSMIRTGVIPSWYFQGGGICGTVDCYSWNGNLLWEFEHHSSTYHQHHDIEPLPNGNFLMISWYKYDEEDAIAMGRNPQMVQNEIWMDHIMEVDPLQDEIVWEWKASDHLIQDFDETKLNYGNVADHPERIDFNYSDFTSPGSYTDWMHTNSVDYNEELDQILISVRNFSEVWVIDHSTTTEEAAGSSGGIYGKGGDLLYRWGNPEAYGRGSSNDQILRAMHDPSWIPADYPEAGKIIVFNNEHGSQQSAVLVFDPPQDAPGIYSDPGDEAFGPETYEWIYTAPNLFSRNISGTQALPNGNVLICEGQGGNFTEVIYDTQELVWRYRSPVGIFGVIEQGEPPEDISQFKIRRYGPDYTGFDGKELVPGDPVELNPWVYECEIYEDTTIISIDDFVLPDHIRYSNPITNEIHLVSDIPSERNIQVFSVSGMMMFEGNMQGKKMSISTGDWPGGLYLVELSSNNSYPKVIKLLKPF